MWATLVFNFLASLLFLVVAAAVGARLRGLLRVPVPPGLRFATDLALGYGAVAVLVTIFAVCRVWKPGLVVGLFLTLTLAGRWRCHRWRVEPLLGPALASLMLLPLALAPPFFYDALVYHLSLPWQWYLQGGMSAPKENVYAFLPPLFSCLASFFLPWGLDRAPALLHLFTFVVAGGGLFWAARSLGAGRFLAHACAFCFPLIPLYVLVPALPAAEGFALVAMAPALAVSLAKRSFPGGLPLGGILLGTALAARLQALPVIGLVGLALAWRYKPRPGQATATLVGFLGASSPWWARNWLLVGNPWLPLGWHGAGLEAAWRDTVSTMHTATTFSDLFRPLAADLGPHLGYLAPLVLTGFLGGVGSRHRRWRLLALMLGAGLLAWDLTAALPRFLAPWSLVLLLWAASAASKPAGRWAAAMALGATASFGVLATTRQLQRLGGLGLALEQEARLYQRLVVNNPLPVFRLANQLLAQDARVLFVGEPRGFGFPRRFQAPSYLDEPELARVVESSKDVGTVLEWLRAQGFSHLLVNWGELERLAPGYPAEPWRTPRGRARFFAFIASVSPPLVQIQGVCLYALAPSGFDKN